jgi:hypothetical protein
LTFKTVDATPRKKRVAGIVSEVLCHNEQLDATPRQKHAAGMTHKERHASMFLAGI